MSGPEDDPLLEFAPNEPPDGVFQSSGDTRAVPPPVHNEIDGLVDAISAGGRPRVSSESPVIAEADDSSSAGVVVTPFALQQSRPSVVHSAAFRYAACAVIAFALGTMIASSVLHRFETSSPTIALNQPAAMESPRTAPLVAPASSAAVTTPSVPVSTAPAIEREPVAVPNTASDAVPIAVPKRARVIAKPLPAAAPPRLDDAPRGNLDLAAVASLAPATVIAPPPAAAAPAPAASAVSVVAVEQNAVLEILREYTRAYQALDVKATAAVWPSVDRRALTRAFSTLKSHQLELEDCRVTIADTSATSHCRGMVEYVRKIGSDTPRTGYQDLVFKMRKLGGDWFIDEVSASELAVARR